MIFILIVYKIESLSDYVRKQSIKFALYPKGRIQITYEIRWLLLEKFIFILSSCIFCMQNPVALYNFLCGYGLWVDSL